MLSQVASPRCIRSLEFCDYVLAGPAGKIKRLLISTTGVA
jgi:hypothetical protein